MGEGLETTPEEERIENPEEAEEIARYENKDRSMAASMRSQKKYAPEAGMLDKLGLRKRETKESLNREAKYHDELADRIGVIIQRVRRDYFQMVEQMGSDWLEEKKDEVKKIQEGQSEKFPELKGKTYEEIVGELGHRREDMRLFVAALEMTDQSPVLKLALLETYNKWREKV